MSATWGTVSLWREGRGGLNAGGKKEIRTGVVDLATSRVDRFQQLVHFLVTHFLAEIGQNWRFSMSALHIHMVPNPDP